MLKRLLPIRKRKLASHFFKNWWVAAFILMALAFYAEASYQKQQEAFFLEEKYAALQKEKVKALDERQELGLQLKSEEDPQWIELVLKYKLGVVPEGETKVVFRK